MRTMLYLSRWLGGVCGVLFLMTMLPTCMAQAAQEATTLPAQKSQLKEISMNICILYGSTRPNRLGIRAVRFLEKNLAQSGHSVTVADAMEEKLPLLENRLMDYEQGQAPARLLALQKIFHEADAFIVITGEYNHTIQPGLANLIDHFQPKDFGHRPVLLVTYSVGAYAGLRALEHARALTSAMGMISIPTTLAIAKIQTILNENNESQDTKFVEQAQKGLTQLLWYAQALKTAKETQGQP
ncbi:MAG: NADPH-dependent FMN reductase [Holosporales bacterium]